MQKEEPGASVNVRIHLGHRRERTSRCRPFFFFSSRRRHTRLQGDWSSDVCSSDLRPQQAPIAMNTAVGLAIVVAGLSRSASDLSGLMRPRTAVLWIPLLLAYWAKIGRASCRERV